MKTTHMGRLAESPRVKFGLGWESVDRGNLETLAKWLVQRASDRRVLSNPRRPKRPEFPPEQGEWSPNDFLEIVEEPIQVVKDPEGNDYEAN